jgi:hypothetical protein
MKAMFASLPSSVMVVGHEGPEESGRTVGLELEDDAADGGRVSGDEAPLRVPVVIDAPRVVDEGNQRDRGAEVRVRPHEPLEGFHRADGLGVGAGVLAVAVGVDDQRVHPSELFRHRGSGEVELVVGPEQRRAGSRFSNRGSREDDVERSREQHDRGARDREFSDPVRDDVADRAEDPDHEGRQVVLGVVGRGEVADHDRVQDLDGEKDRRHPERTEDREVAHLRDRGDENDEEPQEVGDDAQRPGDDQLGHRDGGRFDLGLLGIPVEPRQQQLVVLEETLRHLHGVRDGARRDDHRDHEDQRVEVDAHPARESEPPHRRGDGGDEGNQHAVQAAEVGEQQPERRHHREADEEADLEGVFEDPAAQDRRAGHEQLDVLGFLRVLDLLDVVEDRLVDGPARQAVGNEARHHQRTRLVARDEAPEDVGRVLAHELAERVRVFLRFGQLGHQERVDDRPVRLDLDDPRALVGDRLDLVVVDRVRGVCAVEDARDLLELEPLILERVPHLLALFGVAGVADPVQRLGDARDLRQDLRPEDRSLLHDQPDHDDRRTAELTGELVLRVDEGVIRENRARRRIHAHDRPGQRVAEAGRDGVHRGIEEEESRADQEQRDPPAMSHDESREAEAVVAASRLSGVSVPACTLIPEGIRGQANP